MEQITLEYIDKLLDKYKEDLEGNMELTVSIYRYQLMDLAKETHLSISNIAQQAMNGVIDSFMYMGIRFIILEYSSKKIIDGTGK